ncbi:MAG: MoaD/ThiS family protein [Planctomycetota bacterium]
MTVAFSAVDSRMKISVLLFAKAKDLAGTDRLFVELTNHVKLGDLKRELLRQHPAIVPTGHSLLWAVNNRYATDETIIEPSDVVACFPPVSGG